MIAYKNKEPKSSFLSVEKDLEFIINRICANQRLQKLLYYTTSDCLTQPDLTEDQMLEVLHNNIKLTPKIKIDPNVLNYIGIVFNFFETNDNNPEFRNNFIIFQIICQHDQWQLKDYQLRPYKIAAELDSMFTNEKLSGIGRLEFVTTQLLPINDDFYGITLSFQAIHGEEDKIDMLNPLSQAQFEQDFKKYLKSING